MQRNDFETFLDDEIDAFQEFALTVGGKRQAERLAVSLLDDEGRRIDVDRSTEMSPFWFVHEGAVNASFISGDYLRNKWIVRREWVGGGARGRGTRQRENPH